MLAEKISIIDQSVPAARQMMIEALRILDASPVSAVQLAAVYLCQAIDLMDLDSL